MLDGCKGLCLNCRARQLRRERRYKLRTCAVCAQGFVSARQDAIYCSAACKQRAYRRARDASTIEEAAE
jgi:hypothetical protein